MYIGLSYRFIAPRFRFVYVPGCKQLFLLIRFSSSYFGSENGKTSMSILFYAKYSNPVNRILYFISMLVG